MGRLAPAVPAAELTARALMLALKTTFDPAAAGSLRGRFELRLGEDTFRACVRDGRLELNGDGAGPPEAVIEADRRTLRSVVFGDRQAGEALQAGDLRLSGDRRAALRFLGLFGRSQPAGG